MGGNWTVKAHRIRKQQENLYRGEGMDREDERQKESRGEESGGEVGYRIMIQSFLCFYLIPSANHPETFNSCSP